MDTPMQRPLSPGRLQQSGLSMLLICAAWIASGVILAGCSRAKSPDETSSQPEFATNVTAYQVKGVLKEIRAEGWKALIEHEDIPGFMEAMTMLLDVKDTNVLRGLLPGDAIRFRMLVTDVDGWIDRVQRIGTNVPVAASPPRPAAGGVKELEPGDLLSDCILTNQLGHVVRLSDFQGRALAFTFIFTRCPFPTYCPRMNNNFGEAQRILAAAGGGTNWQLLSISFDPEWDTPARLASYASTYRYDHRHWSFATGALADIRKFGERFGLTFQWTKGTIEHNVRTVVVDANGRVQKVFADNEWSVAALVEEMKKAMVVKP